MREIRRRIAWFTVACFVLYAIDGLLIAALLSHRLPSPVIEPDSAENDGSVALAVVIFSVPVAGTILAGAAG